jgi:hypothetical protein
MAKLDERGERYACALPVSMARFLLRSRFQKGVLPMVGTIVVLLVIMWLLGMISPSSISSWLPILAVIALVVIVIRLISGRHAI